MRRVFEGDGIVLLLGWQECVGCLHQIAQSLKWAGSKSRKYLGGQGSEWEWNQSASTNITTIVT
jgi:hypothetical protein